MRYGVTLQRSYPHITLAPAGRLDVRGGGVVGMKHAIAGGLALLLIGSTSSMGQEKITIRMGVIANSARSISQLGLSIAQRKGFLEKEGVNLKLVPLRGVQHQIEALEQGEVDVSHTATPYLVQAVLKGSDAAAIVGGLANPVFAVLAKPNIKSYSDLKGKVVGLSLPVDTITIGTLKLLARAGVQRSEFTTKELVGTPLRVNCLLSGACDAVPVGQPDDLVLAQNGFVNLGNSLEVIPALQFNVIAARRSWAAANREAVMRYVRAFGAAYRYMNDPVNRAEVSALITETTGAPPDVAKQILTLYFDPYKGIMPKSAGIDMEGMRAVLELMKEAGELQGSLPEAARFVDLQYLEAAGLQ
jgi:ABC-type nitrate/sulfonate/bicarbonate transport system substrate-binding protein